MFVSKNNDRIFPLHPGLMVRWRCALRTNALAAFIGLLKLPDVELAHLQHGLHGGLRLLLVFRLQQVAQDARDDLPREANLVLEPATWAGFALLGKLCPEFIDLLLRVTVDKE